MDNETGSQLLHKRTVLVAGASRGLGYAIAHEAAEQGARVLMGSRDGAVLAKAAETIVSETQGHVEHRVLDVTSPESIGHWLAEAKTLYSSIDGMVVNAGGPPAGSFDAITDEQWEHAFRLTLMSAVRLMRGAIPLMDKGGSIVVITSVSVKEPIDTLVLSNVYRAGVTSLAKSLSRQLAPQGIRVNSMMPGRFDTERVKELDNYLAERQGTTVQSIRQGYEESIPMGRYGQPSEFARMAVFLLSNKSSYVTGATIPVDGGLIKTVW